MSTFFIQQQLLQKQISERRTLVDPAPRSNEKSIVNPSSNISTPNTTKINMREGSQEEDTEDEEDEEHDESYSNQPDLDKMNETLSPSTVFYFLDKEEHVLQYDIENICKEHTDITKPFTIYLCGYEVRVEDRDPYLLYVVEQEGTDVVFPHFEFRCPSGAETEDSEEGEELGGRQVYFKNECSKNILEIMDLDDHSDSEALRDIYKGYIQNKSDPSILYVFLDLSTFTIRKDKDVQKKRMWATMDELFYCKTVLGLTVHPKITELFNANPSILYIKDNKREPIEIPIILYLCESESVGLYKNVYNMEDDSGEDEWVSLVEDRIDHPVLGYFYYFTTDPLQFIAPSIFTIRRFVGFLDNPLYVLHSLSSSVQDLKDKQTTTGSISNTLEETLPNGAGSIIPNIVSYLTRSSTDSSKPVETTDPVDTSAAAEEKELDEKQDIAEEEPEEEPEELDQEEEPEELDQEDQEEETLTIEEQIQDLANVDNQCIYFQETIETKRVGFWCMKSKKCFTEL